MVFKTISTVAAGLFAGAALYVNLVEHAREPVVRRFRVRHTGHGVVVGAPLQPRRNMNGWRN